MENFKHAVNRFIADEEGAQVVEYALIIAVISIGLVIALSDSSTGFAAKLTDLATRVGTCLTTGNC